MKVTTHTPDVLIFEHKSIALGVVLVIAITAGVAAGLAALSMHETWSLEDDFVQIGSGMLLSTLTLGPLLFGATVRTRRLTFDRNAAEIRLESRGLWSKTPQRWPLESLRSIEVSETVLGGTRRIHATQFSFEDGSMTKLGTMDPPTVEAMEGNINTMRQWLASGGLRLSAPAVRPAR